MTGEADSLAELDLLLSDELDSLAELPEDSLPEELPDDSLLEGSALAVSPLEPVLVLDSELVLCAAAFAAAAFLAAAFLAAAALAAAAFLAAVSLAFEELLAVNLELPVEVVFAFEESAGS